MTPEANKKLQLTALRAREGILTAVHGGKSGHPGGSLSSVDMLTYLYFNELRVDPSNPKAPDRDRFVLSKGHCSPALYSVLALRGFFPFESLDQFRHIGSFLQGHPSMLLVPGVDMSTGSLGQGISTACGMAKGAKLSEKDINVFTLLGDGELAEGQVWEAAMFAAHYSLDNLCVIVDCNGLQIDGKCADVMNTAPLDEKFKAFGFNIAMISGHDFNEIEGAVKAFHENKGSGKPFCILMKTVKGKGVSFMENQAGWHGKAPNDEEFAIAMAELAEARKALEEA